MRKSRSGFTIVELLIVIVIIGILAAITIVAYNGIQNRARSAAVADGLKKVEKAFKLYSAEDGRSTWWIDTDTTLTGGAANSGNPFINTVISSTNLKNYLQNTPSITGINTSGWRYDNEGDVYNGCSGGASGVNIIIYNFGTDTGFATQVDKEIDDGNLTCGKFRFSATDTGGAVYYNISSTQSAN